MTMTKTAAGGARPQIGDLLPDFAAQTVDGRMIQRREFKGRRHLVVCCAHPEALDSGRDLLTALAGRYTAIREERGELLFLPARGEVGGIDPGPFPIVVDATPSLRARFGAAESALLLIADRYGEVVLREESAGRAGSAGAALPLERIVPMLAWLEMRCSL